MDYFDSILKKTHRKAVMKRVIAVLSAVVLLFTINTTKKTADTLERIPACGIGEHVHTDACFDVDGNLVCGFVEHVHTDACYQERPKSVEAFEPTVEEYQIELGDADQADNVLSASTEAGSEAYVTSMDIEAPVEESGELELEDINGEDNIAMPSGETEALPESEESQGYIVGTQNPCYLSDIIADQGLNIAIDDVVEIGQAIENDDDPILFNFELVDGDIALYVKEDFARTELVITTEDALHVVELLFGIAPVEETGADAREAEVSADEPADVSLGDIDQEQAIEGEEREGGLAEATGDAVQAGDVEDDRLISEPTEDEAELLDEAAEDIQVEQDAGKDDETAEQADESIEEIADAEESADEQGDAVAADQTEGEAEGEQDDKTVEQADESIEEIADAKESVDEQGDAVAADETEGEAEGEQTDETEEEAEGEQAEEADGEATEEEAESEKSGESKGEQADGEATEEEAESEKSDESRDEGTEEETEDEKSDAADGEEIKEEAEDEQTGEAQGDETEAPDDGAQPVPPEVVYAYYEATIDLADVEAYPIALTDLMAWATWLGVEETAPAADVEGAAAAEPVSEPVETEPAEVDALEEDIPDEGTAEVVEAEAVVPVQSEAAFELDGEEIVEPEVPEVPESDAWVMDYDASVLSVERDGDDYALSILNSFEQTTLTVDNGEQYRITLLNGAAPVLYPAAAFAASTEYVTVSVEAPEGAFPAGTTMVVRDVDDEDTLHGISDKVEEGFVRVERVHAVDITFLNADGEEIEPLIPISVVMTVREIEEEKERLVVHVDHGGEAQLVDNTEPTTAEVSEQNSVVEAADESSAEAGTAVAFTAESFSVYAVVVGEKLETKVIAADGNTYRIEVTYTEDAGIPSGATLDVSEVTGDESYRALVEESLAENKRVTLARFFDIRIMNGAEVIQPAVPVTVKIELISDENQDAEAVPCAVHFAEDEVQVIDATEEDEAVSFRAESFSVWGVVYTVDFHFEGVDYSIPGNSQLLLSGLIDILNITDAAGERISVADVVSVEFTDAHLVTVTQVSGLIAYNGEAGVDVGGKDFLLTSEAPFTSRERLTLTMADGAVIEVDVTDSQAQSTTDLSSLLIEATISAITQEGKYVIIPGETYHIGLVFEENAGTQFSNHETLTYTLPEGLEAANGAGGMFTIKINDGGETYSISGNTAIVENNVLKINFNTSDPNFHHLTAVSNLKFTINIIGIIEITGNKIIFSDSVEKDLVIDTSNSVTATKSATFDRENDRVIYTVAIKSSGFSENIVVTDTITGAALSLDENSISAVSSTGQTVNLQDISVGSDNKRFSCKIPSMRNGEIVTLTYFANVDPSVIQMMEGKVVTVGNNAVHVESDGDPDGDTVNVTTTIDYTPSVSKSNGEVTEEQDDKKTLSWTVTANPECKVSMAGGTITDRIGESSQPYMKYKGGGVYVQRYDKDGNAVGDREFVSAGSADLVMTDTYWTYTVPASDAGEKYKYVITYETEVDASQLHVVTTVYNDVTTDGGKGSSGTAEVIPTGNSVTFKKKIENVDEVNHRATWSAVFTVPKGGLDKAVFWDTYPIREPYIEPVIHDSIVITGLDTVNEPKESYTTDYVTVNGAEKAMVITFKKGTEQGLKGTGQLRTIRITFDTIINQDWVEAWKRNTWYDTHTNSARLILSDGELYSEDSYKLTPPNIKKQMNSKIERTVDGVSLPVYQYTIIITGVKSDSIRIEETFDTTILEPYRSPWQTWYMYGGNSSDWPNDAKGTVEVSYVETATGMVITAEGGALPKKSDTGDYYPAYRLDYYLTVKDAAAMQTLISRAAAEDDGKYVLHNSAEWEDSTDGADVTYEYKGLTKEILTRDSDLQKHGEEIWADFKITLNPGAQMLNNGDPLEIRDEFEGLSIDYSSISAVPAEGVHWDVDGSVATFIIPDRTSVVITYRARVIFSTLEQGVNSVAFKNVATMEGYSGKVEKTATNTLEGSGTGFNPVIRLMKYEAGDMTKTLAGAVFQLLDSEKNPITDKDEHIVTFTTSDGTETDFEGKTIPKGYIIVRGDEEGHGWTLSVDKRYYLREIVAPAGYALSDFDYSFMISKDDTTDYAHYIYHNNDIMSAKNYRGTDVIVEKKWQYTDTSDASAEHDSDTVTVKLQQKRGEGEWSDTIRMRVLNSDTGNKEWQDVRGWTITLDKAGEWCGMFKGLPLEVPVNISNPDGDDVAAEYRVQEILVNDAAPDPEKVDIVQVGNRYYYTVTNRVEPKLGALKLRKAVTVNGRSTITTQADGKFTFIVHRVADGESTADDKTVEIQVSNGAAVSATVNGVSTDLTNDGFVVIGNLPKGEYTVTESDVSDMTTTIAVGDTSGSGRTTTLTVYPEDITAAQTGASATFTNNRNVIAATKKWVSGASEMTGWPEDVASVTFTLYAKVGDGEAAPVEATQYGGAWADIAPSKTINASDAEKKAAWSGLPDKVTVNGTAVDVEYSVVETGVQYVSGSGRTNLTSAEQVRAAYAATWDKDGNTITNTATTERHAVKVWASDTGFETLRPEKIVFTLKAEDSDESPVDLAEYGIIETREMKLTEGVWPEVGWTGLPVYTPEGKLIAYDVEEGEVERYSLIGKTWTEDTKTFAFTNKLVRVVIPGTKTMENRTMTDEDVYAFQIQHFGSNTEGPMPESTTVPNTAEAGASDGGFEFGPIYYTKADMGEIPEQQEGEDTYTKDFEYSIKEVIPETASDGLKENVVYDSTEYNVRVTLTYTYATGDIAVSEPKITIAGATEPTEVDSVAFVNRDVANFSFTKQWRDGSMTEDKPWPKTENGEDDLKITVHLKRKLSDGAEGYIEDAVFNEDQENTYEISPESPDGWSIDTANLPYVFTMSGLQKYGSIAEGEETHKGEFIYYLTEDQVAGYNAPVYLEQVEATGELEENGSGRYSITNGGTVRNIIFIAFELPATGGIGTTPFSILGSALMLLAAALLMTKYRKAHIRQD